MRLPYKIRFSVLFLKGNSENIDRGEKKSVFLSLLAVRNTARQCLSEGTQDVVFVYLQFLLFYLEGKQNSRQEGSVQMNFHVWVWRGTAAARYRHTAPLFTTAGLNTSKSGRNNTFLSFPTQLSICISSRAAVLPLFTDIVPDSLAFPFSFSPLARFLLG